MTVKFLVDESTGIRVSEELERMGYDSLSAIDVMKGAEDLQIVKKAEREKRVIVTNDKDFGWLSTLHKLPGLILLRLRKETPEMKIAVTRNIIQKYEDSLYGHIIVATENKIRIRPL